MQSAKSTRPELVRDLNVWHATAIVAGTIIGSGIFRVPGAMKPWAGGEYVYVRDAYGPLPGFLYAWTWFLIAKPGSIATVTTGIVDVLSTFHRLSFLANSFFTWPITSTRTFEVTYGHLAAIAATVLISALNYVGVKKAGSFQLALTTLKIAMIAA